MQLPTHITRMSGPSSSSSSSSSVSYDYSGQDEINKRKDEAAQLAAAKWKSLYDGDVGGSVAAGERIRSLLSSLRDIKPVRVASESSSSDSRSEASSFEGHHDDLPAKPNPNILAGEPRRMNERRGVIA